MSISQHTVSKCVSFEVLPYMGLPVAKFAKNTRILSRAPCRPLVSIFAMIRSAVAIASAMADSSAGEGRPSQFTGLRGMGKVALG